MLSYLKKFALEIVPSVAATIIGAYIVNHYVVSKPAADAPAAAVMSTAKPKTEPKAAAKGGAKPETEAKQGGEARPDEPTDVAGTPASGVKAKGISEKAILEKNAAAEKAVVIEKPVEKLTPVETTASLPAESRRSVQPPREKTAAKPAPGPVQPVVAAAPAEPAATAGEERRDANDLARAAIERLRGSDTPRTAETARVQEPARTTTAAPAAPGIVKPLPPPIIVAGPPEREDARPPYVAPARADDPARPTPPAEIPTARPPLDLRAEMVAGGAAPREKTSVAEDMLTGVKSMFHAVLPKSSSN